MMIQVTYFVNCYFMCDLKQHFVGLPTVLQLPGSLKFTSGYSCPCCPPRLFLVSEMMQEAQCQRVGGSST